ncbi:MAG: hypothetical protein COB54_07045 [Alphaproteobacteria bacterium]|nr:MAG: hypothetical protein COB54_07045 [Alphaproteobacteria bacterium]
MKLDEFKDNLTVYGADLNKWPDAVRPAAENLLETSVDAQDAFSDATTLDMLINPGLTHPPQNLADKISHKIIKK